MSRPEWPDSTNSLSEIPGTIHSATGMFLVRQQRSTNGDLPTCTPSAGTPSQYRSGVDVLIRESTAVVSELSGLKRNRT